MKRKKKAFLRNQVVSIYEWWSSQDVHKTIIFPQVLLTGTHRGSIKLLKNSAFPSMTGELPANEMFHVEQENQEAMSHCAAGQAAEWLRMNNRLL